MDLRVSIRKKLRDFTLEVDFDVHDEIFALLGASGCGKSMTLKCIAGIEIPDAGKIILNGRTLFDSDKKINLPPQARRAGYLFQNYALFPNMTVAKNISFAATDTSKVAENISRFKLDGLENVYPHQLSGGQQQRVALARVLASHAEILLLDEPFSALDTYLKWQLELELAPILKLYGSAVIVSHDKGEVFRLADTVAVMNHGKISARGSKHEVFQNPKTLAAAILTGCKNISPAKKIADDKIFAADWKLELHAPNVPDNIQAVAIHDLRINDTTAVNTFRLRVVQVIEDLNGFVLILENGLCCESDKFFSVGDEVFVHFPTDKLIPLCH